MSIKSELATAYAIFAIAAGSATLGVGAPTAAFNYIQAYQTKSEASTAPTTRQPSLTARSNRHFGNAVDTTLIAALGAAGTIAGFGLLSRLRQPKFKCL